MTKALNIAVIEDHHDLRKAIVGSLAEQGHHVVGLDSAEAFSEQTAALGFDLLVVDINLPGEDGLSLAARTRKTEPNVGIIMLTGRNKLNDRRQGYDNGADIYLTKPATLDEIIAATNALSRRLKPAFIASPYRLDLKGLTIHSPMGCEKLQAPEAVILSSFVRAKDQKLETWQILELLQWTRAAPSRNAINILIHRLNQKMVSLGVDDHPIRAIRNWGYRLCVGLTVDET